MIHFATKKAHHDRPCADDMLPGPVENGIRKCKTMQEQSDDEVAREKHYFNRYGKPGGTSQSCRCAASLRHGKEQHRQFVVSVDIDSPGISPRNQEDEEDCDFDAGESVESGYSSSTSSAVAHGIDKNRRCSSPILSPIFRGLLDGQNRDDSIEEWVCELFEETSKG
jgi:hypothetical protein